MWAKNPWTGDCLLSCGPARRILRTGTEGSYLYRAEYWGDYSLTYPVYGRWRASLSAAKKDLEALEKPLTPEAEGTNL